MKVFKNVEVEVVELVMVIMEVFGKGIVVDRLCYFYFDIFKYFYKFEK